MRQEPDQPRRAAASCALEWRGAFTNAEVNGLHAACFGEADTDRNWRGHAERLSLGWVCLRAESELVGFLNVPWDGGVHSFIVDLMVAKSFRRRGYGARMVRAAARRAAEAGCEWLHADFESHLRPFYLDACQLSETDAGVLRLI